MIIKLSRNDEIRAHVTAMARIREIEGSPDHHSRHNKAINFHEYVSEVAESIGAEMAMARYFGDHDFRPTINTFKQEADYGSNIEVKWTKYESGSLILGNTDRDSDIAVLIVGRSPVYRIAGWIPVVMGKRDRYYLAKQRSWWIGQGNLQSIETLKRSSYGEMASKMPNL